MLRHKSSSFTFFNDSYSAISKDKDNITVQTCAGVLTSWDHIFSENEKSQDILNFKQKFIYSRSKLYDVLTRCLINQNENNNNEEGITYSFEQSAVSAQLDSGKPQHQLLIKIKQRYNGLCEIMEL